MKRFLAAFAGLGLAQAAMAQPAPVASPVGVFDATVSGQPIVLPQGPAQVTVVRSDLPAGATIPPHRHAYPRFNYVLAGGVKVTNLDTGQVQEFRQGQFIAETVGQWHKGEALDGKPASLLTIDETPPGKGNMERQVP